MKVFLKSKLTQVIEIVDQPEGAVEVDIAATSLGVHLNAQTLNGSSQAYLLNIYAVNKPVEFPKVEDHGD